MTIMTIDLNKKTRSSFLFCILNNQAFTKIVKMHSTNLKKMKKILFNKDVIAIIIVKNLIQYS